jgi:hypothetical protein
MQLDTVDHPWFGHAYLPARAAEELTDPPRQACQVWC